MKKFNPQQHYYGRTMKPIFKYKLARKLYVFFDNTLWYLWIPLLVYNVGIYGIHLLNKYYGFIEGQTLINILWIVGSVGIIAVGIRWAEAFWLGEFWYKYTFVKEKQWAS